MMLGIRNSTGRFLDCSEGSFVTVAAIVFLIIAGLAGGAVDFYIYSGQRAHLQDVADTAALAAAREAALEGWSQSTAKAVVDTLVDANLKSLGSGSVVYSSDVQVDTTHRRVTVTIDQDHYGYFVGGYFRNSPQIRVSSAAQASGSTNVCVIGLDSASGGTIELTEESELFSPECAVYSNSNDQGGLQSNDDAMLTANLACSAGGYKGATRNYNRRPLTDCPQMADPLVSRKPPPIGPCFPGLLRLVLESVPLIQLKAGVTYCGGLTIKGNTQVIFLPGVHVFKDGPLIVDDNAKVDGLGGVGLYFTGNNAYFDFRKNANVDLQAPDSGPMAGLLAFQDRASQVTDFKIASDFTRNLIGTIYLPKGNLIIDANNDVAKESAYTAIVVHKLKLKAGPKLVLNTDYDETTVPVPDGLGPTGGNPRLVQ